MTRPPARGNARGTARWRAAAAWVVIATAVAAVADERAQIGLYVERTAPAVEVSLDGVRAGLRRAGLERVFERSAPNDPDAVRGVLAGLELEPVDVVVAAGPRAAAAARDGIRHVAVVFTGVGRPEALGLPGRANVCGTAGGVPGTDVLEAVRRAAPDLRGVAVMTTDDDREDAAFRSEVHVAARAAGIAARDADLLDPRTGALILAENVTVARADEIATELAGQGVLLVGTRRAHLDAGAALVVRTDPRAIGSTAAALVLRIVHGEAPEAIGVVRPTRRLLEVNLDAARRLGVTIPLVAVAGADHVVPDFGGGR